MAFDNDYPNRKDWRKPYRGARGFCRSCRNHGGCPYCESNRLYQYRKELERIDAEITDYYTEEEEILG